MMDKSKQRVKKRIIVAVIIILIAIIVPVLCLLYILPYQGSNGTEKFTGDERKIAEATIEHFGSISDIRLIDNSKGIIINSVRATTDEEKQFSPKPFCRSESWNNRAKEIYVVNVSYKNTFGITTGSFDTCVPLYKTK